MGVLEELLKEIKLLNQNIRVLNTELATVDTSTKQNVVKETPEIKETNSKQPEKETAKTEETSEDTSSFTKDYVLNLGKEFLKNGDQTDKAAFKEKLTELDANKLSTLDEKHFPEIVDFMKARLSA
ncbi:hypothetical protein [Staphylococcus hominis]|uniref:hypothetical protein n=1 Tax=Staphylococcus hominis TaxID=1290 RepID=UPI00119E1750|nr:hypothetical protein [Staphylococcus hominis]